MGISGCVPLLAFNFFLNGVTFFHYDILGAMDVRSMVVLMSLDWLADVTSLDLLFLFLLLFLTFVGHHHLMSSEW